MVYIVPYTSVIEQNAQVFRKMLGDNNVLEHHAGSPADMDEDASPEQRRGALAAENWGAPVVVTTAVRFFEAMYANRPAKCRRLHNLANSVLIFDEAQMLPVEHLRPCVAAIAQLVKNFRSTAVLCTASQPALDRQFRPYGLTPSELFAALPEEGSFHLSTLMCPAHRRAVLARIRKRLDAGMPCRVVSTSLVEAGVDVDFPAVYRQMAGLDSILQAAGRCNREGKNPAALLEAVTLRIRAERDINRQKAAILKAYYLKSQNDDCPKEVLQVRLNEASTNIPYTFGRLFAVYEAIQKAANPGINTTIRDKYFNAAASTPAMIFPILDNLCLKHLRKLPAGRRISLDRQVGALKDILGEEYPLRLNLPEQGSFNQGRSAGREDKRLHVRKLF